jgi:PAT family beta-lactamase induction signal transducer AmpG
MINWISQIAGVYANKQILLISFLGFMSGLPLLLTSSTLSVWLSEEGVTKATIGAFGLVALPYTFKFLWAPFFDYIKIPFLTKLLGRRRSFMMLMQILLAASLLALGFINPRAYPFLVALFALCVSFFSASQDIIIDAYRVEILHEKNYGAGAASVVFGYRIGMLVAGAGALYLAEVVSWNSVYFTMAFLVLLGMIICLFCDEPAQNLYPQAPSTNSLMRKSLRAPLFEFIKNKHWIAVFLVILFYKLGDAFLTSMSNVFFLESGFSKVEIANVAKVFGLISTLAGGFIAGIMSSRLGIMRSMLMCGVIHIVANFIFVIQAYVGYSVPMLICTIAIENVTSGMTGVALVAYISSLCRGANTATQYALLSSIIAFGRTVLTSFSGLIATNLGWSLYFVFTSLIALPALIILFWLLRSEEQRPQQKNLDPVQA